MPTIFEYTQEDLIDEYLMDRLSGARLAELEEHLLICEACRQCMTDAEAFSSGTRAALLEMRAKSRVFTAGS